VGIPLKKLARQTPSWIQRKGPFRKETVKERDIRERKGGRGEERGMTLRYCSFVCGSVA